MKQRQIEIALFIFTLILLAVSLFFNREGIVDRNRAEYSKKLTDSLINVNILKAEQSAIYHEKRADSCINYVKVYVIADSINFYKMEHEKSKTHFLTADQRNHVRDSIFTANHIK